ncbi:hypothetical protein AQUCO_04200204v1 [Aquilegia coerulea]|uniref:DNA polymerase kappa n=1 Tax=Aquilegia coerulea TaxID=218851 RepID=A0A2G5CPQ6_AQUCA|nr:hypothetical protein AQUCO_04200204v1 [Aquilegia coerulea]
MYGVDKEKVQKEAKNVERKEEFIKQKVEKMHTQCAKLTAADISHYKTVADKKIVELEATRDLSRTWLHLEMDAFYAAVETKENPSLVGKPMAVGSMSMILTANYEARLFGVRAAMPGFIAQKVCPELIFVPVDFKKYTHYSELSRKVFHKYDPNFVASSLDEAYLDISEVCKARGITSEEIASELRAGVYEETGLTCSAGVAPNRMIAKVCSDINKPNGHFVLPNDRIAVVTFISSLPIWKIGGIGKVTDHILKDVLGISTCEEILQNSAYLCALFSHSLIDFFLSVALGLGKTRTPEARSRKSISNERTFSAIADEASLYNKIEHKRWNIMKERSSQKPGGNQMDVKDVHKRDEWMKTGGDENNVWHHDCFHELKADALPPTRKRPGFVEKIVEQESGNPAERTATVSGPPTSIERPASENARGEKWEDVTSTGTELTEEIEYHHNGEKHKGLAFWDETDSMEGVQKETRIATNGSMTYLMRSTRVHLQRTTNGSMTCLMRSIRVHLQRTQTIRLQRLKHSWHLNKGRVLSITLIC